ncbi:MAG: CCA tRNA nucleotidyltransferase [Campylobacter sp.]|nr:CCA tRNA nucleotidyltransferase [Campylobacter sp.]
MNDLKIYQNKDFLFLKKTLAKFTKRAYFVGGFVRDKIMGIDSFDIDIEVYDIDPVKFDEIMNSIGAKGHGKSFFVYKYANFDIALPRVENKNGVGHKAFEVRVCNDECIASKRRDFTMNSVMINIFDLQILDSYGGIADLQNGILRVINESSFKEDSLRVLRAVQFGARFGFKIEPKSLKIMREMSLFDLSRNRINSELKKLFNAKYQGYGLLLLKTLEIFKLCFGFEISSKACFESAKLIDKTLKFIKDDERVFLYVLANLNGINIANLLEYMGLENAYKSLINEPFFLNPTEYDLMSIALKKPICKWLGLNSNDIIETSKKFGIYDKKFDPQISSKDVIDDGFIGPQISKEIKRRENLAICKFLEYKI